MFNGFYIYHNETNFEFFFIPFECLGKSVRRRAASMETSKFEKRRGRAKKRVEALRSAQALGIGSEYSLCINLCIR